ANHGVMMAPRLVQDVESPGGHVISRTKPLILSRVMSRESASQVTDGMVFVVQHGSGFEAAVQGMEVAGKTGTAVSGASTANAWFISFAPARHPRVAVAVLNQYAGEGFAHAAPIARKVMLAALARH
ncbi:MAG: penicillin-binding transpeptidase domain-containing protein, partial [Chloroflexota bacterium]